MLKTGIINRVTAKGIDLMIVFLLAALLPAVVGPLIGFAYSLIGDGLKWGGFAGQSVGKRLFGFQVRNTVTKEPAGFRESAIRNTPVGVATFFAIIPVWGWVILFLIGIPLMMIEVYLMTRVEGSRRLGDVMADTEVVIEKEALNGAQTESVAEAASAQPKTKKPMRAEGEREKSKEKPT